MLHHTTANQLKHHITHSQSAHMLHHPSANQLKHHITHSQSAQMLHHTSANQLKHHITSANQHLASHNLWGEGNLLFLGVEGNSGKQLILCHAYHKIKPVRNSLLDFQGQRTHLGGKAAAPPPERRDYVPGKGV